MIAVCIASSSSSSSSSARLLSLKPPNSSIPLPKLDYSNEFLIKRNRNVFKNKGICRAEFSGDAPFAAAIGASMLSSLLLPKAVDTADEDGDSAIDSTDTRLTAMGIISFIPYFNWLSWVFAWLDTGKRRYAVYALVYLAPYLRSNMSLSPEESWLPVASIVLGIIHVQLEASIKNGDLEGFQISKVAANIFSPKVKKKELEKNNSTLNDHQAPSEHEASIKNGDLEGFQILKDAANFLSPMMKDLNLEDHEGLLEEGRKEHGNQPSAVEEQLRNGVHREPSKHPEHSNGGWDDEERRKG